MNKKITAPKGTHDIIPGESHAWQHIENIIKSICSNYGYKQIRFPVFENTELFDRGVGDTTDVVQKEMYTFTDKGGRSLSLRPEGTASAVRCYIEHNFQNIPAPVKLFYLITCYRYERPQSGRYREFNQFGIENFGSNSPATDAEVIALAMNVLKSAGIADLKLYINSIGCSECRKKYNEVLMAYLEAHKDCLCDLCKDRMTRNPLRVLDCKNSSCHEIIKDAPTVDSVLCDDCKTHFEALKKHLDEISIPYIVDTTLVRGLDYYTKTVFEIKSDDLGAQSTVCGGGRYDGLVEQLGGAATPGIGFSLGIERLMNILQSKGIIIEDTDTPDIYIASLGENALNFAFKACEALRCNGIKAEFDHASRSVKAQMKYADKINARYCVVIGDDELAQGKANLKKMDDGSTVEINLADLSGGILNG